MKILIISPSSPPSQVVTDITQAIVDGHDVHDSMFGPGCYAIGRLFLTARQTDGFDTEATLWGEFVYGEPFGRKKSQVRFYYRDDGEGLSKSPRVPVNKRRNSQNERVTVPTGQTYT